MLKKLFLQDGPSSATDSSSEVVASTDVKSDFKSSDFKSLEEQLQELDQHLSQKLQEKSRFTEAQKNAELISSHESASPDENQQDPDDNTKEFIQLADFISKERNKKASAESNTSDKIIKMQKYISVKTKEFEAQARQKGLQINKAA